MKCPRCNREFKKLLALSRKDNKTMICDDCGMLEAFEDWQNYLEKQEEMHNDRTK